MRKLLLLILLLFVLTGCNKTEEAVIENTKKLEVPITDTTYVTIEVEDLDIIETDNSVYWVLSDGTVIATTDIASDYATSDNHFTWLYHRFDEGSVILHVPDCKWVFYGNSLSDLKESGRDLTLNEEFKINTLPDYEKMKMVLLDNNLYMPEGTVETNVNGVTSSLYNDGSKWLKSWIFDGDFQDVSTSLVSTVLLNSGKGIDSWYYDNNIFFVTSGDNIIAAKKLQYNEWYVYYGSSEFIDYILTGVNTVRSSL